MTNDHTIETPIGPISKQMLDDLVKTIHRAWDKSEDEYVQSYRDKVKFIGEDCLIDECAEEHLGAVGKFMFYSLQQVIKSECELVHGTRYNQNGSEIPLVNKPMKIGPTEEAEIPFKGWFHVIHNNTGRKFAIHIYVDYQGEQVISVSCDSALGNAKDFHDWIKEWFYQNGPMKGAVLNAGLEFLEIDANYSMDDVILDTEVNSALDLHVFSFLKNIDSFTKLGLSSSRGVLLAGPPGTGKTSFCRAVLNNRLDSTLFYITSDDVSNQGTITEIYSHARAF
ncbi:MAG: AAA family ATPase, partial [Candidatus Poseidoniales archaeon]